MVTSLRAYALVLAIAFVFPAAWVGSAQPLPEVPGAPAVPPPPGVPQAPAVPPLACEAYVARDPCSLTEPMNVCKRALSWAMCEGGARCNLGVGAAGGCAAFAKVIGTPGAIDSASSVAVSPSGDRFVMTGTTRGTSHDARALLMDSATGEEVWSTSFDAGSNLDDFAGGVVFSQDGSKVFTTGTSHYGPPPGGSERDFRTVAYDAKTGTELWRQRWDGGEKGMDLGGWIALSPDGSKLYVAGGNYRAGKLIHHAIVAYDASSGAELWSARLGDPGATLSSLAGIEVHPDGSAVYLSTSLWDPVNGWDVVSAAYAASNGALLWSQKSGVAGDDRANDVTLSPDGKTLYAVGSANANFLVAAISTAGGSVTWTASAGFVGTTEYATAVTVSPDGAVVYVTGTDGTNSGFLTVAFEATTGAQRWLSRTAPEPQSFTRYSAPRHIASSADGVTLYVTGDSSDSPTRGDVATVHILAATGSLLSATRHDTGPNSDDRAFSVALSPRGDKLYAVGWTQRLSEPQDMLLLAVSTGRPALPVLPAIPGSP